MPCIQIIALSWLKSSKEKSNGNININFNSKLEDKYFKELNPAPEVENRTGEAIRFNLFVFKEKIKRISTSNEVH